MAVTEETPIASSVANGVTRVFLHSFTVLDGGDLVVTGTVSNVTTTYTLGVDYTLSGVGTPSGSVTFVTPPASGTIVTRYRDIALTRETDYQDNGDLLADVLNADMDRLVFMLQDIFNGGKVVPTCVRAPNGETLNALPSALARAGYFLGFDGSGQPTLLAATAGTAAALSADLASASDAIKGDALIGVKRTETGAVATTQHAINQSTRLNIVSHFGASKDNTNTSATTAALVAAIAAAAVIGNAVVEIPDGSYSITAGTNLASAGVAIEGMGRPTLNFVGSGIAASFDSGSNGGTVYGMRLENVIIKGNAATTTGLYSRGMVHMLVRHVEVRECGGTAFRIMHGVDNHYDTCIYSTNAIAQTTKPSVGFALDNNGAGYYTANCTFTNCVSEGFTGTGVQINDARGNLFLGGTFEAITGKGLEITSDTCSDNTFVNVWCEANTVNDAVIKGVGNTFTGCRFQSATSGNTVDVTTGTGTRFYGGYARQVNLGASSSNTTFHGVRFSDNPSLGITGTGSYTAVGCTRSDVNDAITAKYADRVGEPGGTWTPALATSGGGSQGAVTTAAGTHYRVGNVAHVSFTLVVAKGTLAAGAVSVTGLPFTSRNTANAFQYLTLGEYESISLGANYTNLALLIAPNSTVATLIKTGTGVASATVALADLPATVTLRASGSYQIEA